MPKFSDAHTRALEVVAAASKINSRLHRQQREGTTNQGDRELERTVHHIVSSLGLLAESFSSIADQTQTLGWEQVGHVTHEQLTTAAQALAQVAQQLPGQPR